MEESKPVDTDAEAGTIVKSQLPPAKRWNNPFSMPDSNVQPVCGLFGWQPTWLQPLANMKVFMVCFVALGVFYGLSHSYFGAVLPSIERRFGFSSTQIGTVRSMNDVSHMVAALVIGHYGGSGHRPRWIATGMFLLGLAMLLYASPEIFFPYERPNSGTVNGTIGGNSPREDFCQADKAAAPCIQTTNGNIGPLVVFGIAEFLIGLGSTTHMILGLPYVDDNVSYRNTPFYFAMSFAGRLFGPLLGYGFGSLANSLYFDLSVPDFPQTDPRWISAWYLAFLVGGIGVCLFAVTVGFFPAVMPTREKHTTGTSDGDEAKGTVSQIKKRRPKPKVTLIDLPKNMFKLITNSTYMLKLCSQVLEGLVIQGYQGFAQKFIQNQYPIAPSIASLAGGMPPVFTGFLGIAFGGFIIKRFNFQPRQVSMMTVVASVTASACYFTVLAIGCDTPMVIGSATLATTSAFEAQAEELMNTCNIQNQCQCRITQFSPVCDTEVNLSYTSPCFAGCKGKQVVDRVNHYSECACLQKSQKDDAVRFHKLVTGRASESISQKVKPGLCPSACTTNDFINYVALMSVAKFLMGIPFAGILMIQFRIVRYDLKSLANAATSVAVSGLGSLPAPILAGFVIDSTCRFWRTSACGVQGNCILYDVATFRTKLHATVGIVKLIAAFVDCLVTYKLWNLSFERGDEEEKKASSTNEQAAIEDGAVSPDIVPDRQLQTATEE